jgi:hypothetical protein
MPATIVSRLRARAVEAITKTFGGRIAPKIAQGERNVTLMRIASRLRWRFNLAEPEIRGGSDFPE